MIGNGPCGRPVRIMKITATADSGAAKRSQSRAPVRPRPLSPPIAALAAAINLGTLSMLNRVVDNSGAVSAGRKKAISARPAATTGTAAFWRDRNCRRLAASLDFRASMSTAAPRPPMAEIAG
ncbi:hypothetical protein D3C80_597060 [compost metagenome]